MKYSHRNVRFIFAHQFGTLLNRLLSPSIPIEVTEVRLLPGGRSKETYIISVAPNEVVPERMVLRQDASAFSVDAGPHNLLIHDNSTSAILDWELVHVDDPAEDLAYLRSAIEKQFPWKDFLDIYYRNGGQAVDERRLKIFSVYVLVRNASLSASAASAFIKGESDDFMIGAIGIIPIPFMENQLIALIGNG